MIWSFILHTVEDRVDDHSCFSFRWSTSDLLTFAETVDEWVETSDETSDDVDDG